MWSFGIVFAKSTTRPLQALAGQDPDVLVWWGSQVECVSALTRLERAGALDTKAVSTSFERLKQLADSWHEVEPGGIVAESAVRFLRVHSLRAADALQLAAAFVAAGAGRPRCNS
jgi:uncharacterized protein